MAGSIIKQIRKKLNRLGIGEACSPTLLSMGGRGGMHPPAFCISPPPPPPPPLLFESCLRPWVLSNAWHGRAQDTIGGAWSLENEKSLSSWPFCPLCCVVISCSIITLLHSTRDYGFSFIFRSYLSNRWQLIQCASIGDTGVYLISRLWS